MERTFTKDWLPSSVFKALIDFGQAMKDLGADSGECGVTLPHSVFLRMRDGLRAEIEQDLRMGAGIQFCAVRYVPSSEQEISLMPSAAGWSVEPRLDGA